MECLGYGFCWVVGGLGLVRDDIWWVWMIYEYGRVVNFGEVVLGLNWDIVYECLGCGFCWVVVGDGGLGFG